MWYRSVLTKKILHSSAAKILDHIYGKGTFDALIKTDILEELISPSVIDVLRGTDSTKLAVLRYQEIHHCNLKEARYGVNRLKKDMARKQKKRADE